MERNGQTLLMLPTEPTESGKQYQGRRIMDCPDLNQSHMHWFDRWCDPRIFSVERQECLVNDCVVGFREVKKDRNQ